MATGGRLEHALVRRAIPEVETETLMRVQEEEHAAEDYEQASIRDLLNQVQDLYNLRDPANDRIGRIKDTLVTRLSPIYDDNQQLSLFDDLSGLAFRDPKDNEQIVIQHPEVPIQFRMKRVQVTRWKETMRSISQEAERRTLELERLDALAQEQLTEQDRLTAEYTRGYRAALEWAVEQSEIRHGYRVSGRFVASVPKDRD